LSAPFPRDILPQEKKVRFVDNEIEEAIRSLERLARTRGGRRGRSPAWMKAAPGATPTNPDDTPRAAVALPIPFTFTDAISRRRLQVSRSA